MRIADWTCAALCGAWLLALLWISVPQHDLLRALWSSTMAAWLQAIGSVVAIGAAVWIDRGSSRRAVEADWKRRRRMTIGFYTAAFEVVIWIAACSALASDPRHEALARRVASGNGFRVHLTHGDEVLRGFATADLADIGFLAHAIRLRQQASVALASLGDGTYETLREARIQLSGCAASAIATFGTIAQDADLPAKDFDAEAERVLATAA